MIEIVVIVAVVIIVALVAKKAAKKGHAPHTIDTAACREQNGFRSIQGKWEKMGRDFETFVITRFDNREYRLIEWRSDKYIRGWGGPESSRAPDILMEHIPSGHRFAIECKFRSRFHGQRLSWAKPDQLQSYRDYATVQMIPVYVAIGVGGDPASPEELFIIKLERMKFPDVMRYYLEKFRFPADVTGLEFG